jgi:hypothetical protein
VYQNGRYTAVQGAAKDVTEWPHDVVPAGTWVYVIAWNQAQPEDGYELAEWHSGYRWVDAQEVVFHVVGDIHDALLIKTNAIARA